MDYYNAINNFGMNTYSDREMEDDSPVWDENELRDQTEMESFIEDLDNAIDNNVFSIVGVDGEENPTFSITIKDSFETYTLKKGLLWIDDVDIHLTIDVLGDLFITAYVDGFTYYEDKKIEKFAIQNNDRLLNIFKGLAELHYIFHPRQS